MCPISRVVSLLLAVCSVAGCNSVASRIEPQREERSWHARVLEIVRARHLVTYQQSIDEFRSSRQVFVGWLAVHDNGLEAGARERDWPRSPAIGCPASGGAPVVWRDQGYLQFTGSTVSFSESGRGAECGGCAPTPRGDQLLIDIDASAGRTGCTNCPERGFYRLKVSGQLARVAMTEVTAEQMLECLGSLRNHLVRGDELVRPIEEWGVEPAPELAARAKPGHSYCTANWSYRGEMWLPKARPLVVGMRDLDVRVSLSCCDGPPPPARSTPSFEPEPQPDCQAIVIER